MRRRWMPLVLALLVLISAAAGSALARGELVVHYIDVGQGEAALLQGPGFAILIDAGNIGGREVLDYLTQLQVEAIDLLVVTHPHADHIGQAAEVLRTFPVREVWMSGYEHYTKAFEELLDAVLDSDADYFEPRAGFERSYGELELQVLNPPQGELSRNVHETCLMLKAVYGQIAFLFTGDAEQRTEKALVARGLPLQAHVLQLGHHASRTSSALEFLVAVEPDAAVYSAGVGNDFGHPHPEVLNRLKILEIPVYGTDRYGTIVVRTDGQTYSLETEKKGQLNEEDILGGVDLNTASWEELQLIIHIGPERAGQIIEEREKRPFRSVDELKERIKGIGEKTLAEIKAQGLVCVKGVNGY